jgi:hypothetical protein
MHPLTDPQRRSVDDAATSLRGITRQLAAILQSLEGVPGTGVVRDALQVVRGMLWMEYTTLGKLITPPDVDGPEPACGTIRDANP